MTSQLAPEPASAWVRGLISAYGASPANTLRDATNETAWASPLVGFARGDDPIFEQYKEVVGPFHWTPWEIFTLTYPASDARPEELSVISWILPQTEATKADSRRATFYPPERWARSRIFGEEFNAHLAIHLASALSEADYQAVAPGRSPLWKSVPSEQYVYASLWSERHAAYACGLGTFGLCDGLITPVGKAMRAGSVVARIALPVASRPYGDHHAYCLYYAKGTCGACMTRCPAGAITPQGHDKVRCRDHVNKTRAYVVQNYGFEGYGCGLCQTGVPCESGIPPELR
jgi:epoxyqueuosine reductase QueG